MGRWEAVAKIVETFVNSERPGYGLAALIVMSISSLLLALLLIMAGAGSVRTWLTPLPASVISHLSTR